MKDLGAIGGPFSSASSINDSGQIVGETGLSNNGSSLIRLFTAMAA